MGQLHRAVEPMSRSHKNIHLMGTFFQLKSTQGLLKMHWPKAGSLIEGIDANLLSDYNLYKLYVLYVSNFSPFLTKYNYIK